MRKFRSRRGETLAEVLIALFIIALAALLLATMSTASAGINLTARRKDDEFYEALSRVEALTDSTKAGGTYTVVITDDADTVVDSTSVEIYRSEDNSLALYKETP